MYAIVRTGSKQYRVHENDVILVEKIVAEPGASIELDEVLMLDAGSGVQVGAPLVAGARVAATVLEQTKGEKVLSFKRRRRKHYRRVRGHRQNLTVLRITDILPVGAERKARAEATPSEGETRPRRTRRTSAGTAGEGDAKPARAKRKKSGAAASEEK
jgi:large subunit ribosomal protein L21